MSAQAHQTAILIPLLVGVIPFVCTFVIHAAALKVSVNYVRRERRLGRAGTSFWLDIAIVVTAMSSLLMAHLVELGVWAVVFVWCGEFPSFGAAYYHSAVNYTTLGYGDIIMTPRWVLLGPLEAANGMLLFGFSTAILFALIQRLIEAKYADLRQ